VGSYLTTVLIAALFFIVLDTGVLSEKNISVVTSAQPAPISDNNTERTTNQFNEINASSTITTITPKVIDIRPVPNGSALPEVNASAVEERTEFLKVMKGIESSAEALVSGEEMQVNASSSLSESSLMAWNLEPSSSSSSIIGQSQLPFPLQANNSIMERTTTLHSTPNPVKIYQDSNLQGTIPPEALFYRNEPAVARSGNEIFYVGTYYGAKSDDGGNTWSYIDLLSQMPNTCCDSDVMFDNRNQVFLWSMMNIPYSTNSPELGEVNNITIGVSSDTTRWTFYEISASAINSSWTHNVFDYPQLFLTEKFVYISVDRFSEFSSSQMEAKFEGPVMMRIERDALASGGPFAMQFMYSSPPAEVFTAVQGADDVLYWATHITESPGSTMRLYSWGDNSTTIRLIDRDVDSWNESNSFTCITPDNFNWCGNSDHRITGGWKIGNVIGFIWNVPAGGGFPYAYVDAATFNVSDMTYIGRPYLKSNVHDWAFAYVSPDRGMLGIVASFGGGNLTGLYPGSAVGVGVPSWLGGDISWHMRYAVNGTNRPEANEWGDYVRTSAVNATDNEARWIGTGFVLDGGSATEFINPHYFEYGFVPIPSHPPCPTHPCRP
jgi:hypothetical protein